MCLCTEQAVLIAVCSGMCYDTRSVIFTKIYRRRRRKMKLMRTEDAVGSILCQDVTQIIKDRFKGPVFRKGHGLKVLRGDVKNCADDRNGEEK